MNYWKLGCRWYTNAPLFYKYLLENKIVISWTGKKYNVNDQVLLTDGHTSLGIATVTSEPIPVVNLSQYVDSFNQFKIPTTDKNLLVFEANIFSIDKHEQFTYKLQSGIRRIQKKLIKQTITNLVNNNLKNKNMSDTLKVLQYKKQIILQGPPGTGKTRKAELIAKEILGISNIAQLQNHDQYKIVQFHPSYTYEDFVRGIVAKSNGESIEYKNVNKTIGKFAKVAKENFDNHNKELYIVSKK